MTWINETTFNSLLIAIAAVFSFANTIFIFITKRQSDRNGAAIAEVHACLDQAVTVQRASLVVGNERHAENVDRLETIKDAVVTKDDTPS